MVVYAPGSQERDPSKQNMALQDHAKKIGDNTASISALQTTVAGLPTSAVTSVATVGLATGGPITTTGTVTVTAASKSDQTTATSNTVAVTPLHQQDHDSAAKAWVYFTVSAGTVTVQASYNVSSVTRASAGVFTVNFTTAFATANYVVAGMAESHTINTGHTGDNTTRSASSAQFITLNAATGAAADPGAASVVCFGRQ